jgi:hypothetical protein
MLAQLTGRCPAARRDLFADPRGADRLENHSRTGPCDSRARQTFRGGVSHGNLGH